MMKTMGHLLKLATIFFCALHMSCYPTQRLINEKCLFETIDFLLMEDNEAKIHSKEELLVVLNFIKNDKALFRTALVPKNLYPQYLVGKTTNKAKGYFNYDNVIVLVYGDYPSYLRLQPIEDDMIFMVPTRVKEPKESNPPFPPFLVEPLVYSFVKADNCYSLTNKTVADTLLQ